MITAQKMYWFIAVALFLCVSWSAIYFQPGAHIFYNDYWEHSAAITEWKKNIWDPGNPHLAEESKTPRYMPYYLVLTVIANIFQIDAIQALGVGSIFATMIFVIGVYLFSREYFNNELAPLISIIVFTSAWGIAWSWSNVYQLKHIFHVAAYPSHMVFGLSLLAFYFTLKLKNLEHFNLFYHILFALLISFMYLTHPLTAAFAVCSIFLLVLLTDRHAKKSLKLNILLFTLLGLAISELWPYFSVWQVVLGKTGNEATSWLANDTTQKMSRMKDLYWSHPFYSPTQVIATLGPSVLAIPIFFYMLFKRKHPFILVGTIIMCLPYLLNTIIRIPLGHRMLLFHIFFLHLILIWFLIENLHGLKLRDVYKKPIVYFVIAIIAWNISLACLELSGIRLSPPFSIKTNLYTSIESDYKQLAKALPQNTIILAPKIISWPMPTFFGKVVNLHHPNPLVDDNVIRNNDANVFFDSKTSISEQRNILEKYNVHYVIINQKLKQIEQPPPPELTHFIYEYNSYKIYQVDSKSVGKANI